MRMLRNVRRSFRPSRSSSGIGKRKQSKQKQIFPKPTAERTVGFFVLDRFFTNNHFMSTTTEPDSISRTPFRTPTSRELLEALVRAYREFGLSEIDARLAAAADLESDLGHVALAA
jgi:hypothetical protein